MRPVGIAQYSSYGMNLYPHDVVMRILILLSIIMYDLLMQDELSKTGCRPLLNSMDSCLRRKPSNSSPVMPYDRWVPSFCPDTSVTCRNFTRLGFITPMISEKSSDKQSLVTVMFSFTLTPNEWARSATRITLSR